MKKSKVTLVAHGGVGGPLENLDGVEKAARKGLAVLRRGGPALTAAVEAVVSMEDDPRFNAGTGSLLRLDGSIEMDAAVMDSELHCGAVAAITGIKNPVRVAVKVIDTPHVLLVGPSATEFARRCGFESWSPVTEKAVVRLAQVREQIRTGKVPKYARKWLKFGCDTVGAVAMDSKGRFAVAGSTGGVPIALRGRVGDTPIIGCGLYAGKAGAVAATGVGEEIIRHVLSKAVYDRMAEGMSAQEACDWGMAFFPDYVPVGLIAVSRKGGGMANTGQMPACVVGG
jgi:beta-aspartyl-peptidase (threonine type)